MLTAKASAEYGQRLGPTEQIAGVLAGVEHLGGPRFAGRLAVRPALHVPQDQHAQPPDGFFGRPDVVCAVHGGPLGAQAYQLRPDVFGKEAVTIRRGFIEKPLEEYVGIEETALQIQIGQAHR